MFFGRTGLIYNKLYDRMYQAGVSFHQMRICEPYGSEQKRGLWLFHVVEPETWGKVVSRVSGANFGALYSRERGNVSGNGVKKLGNMSWKEYAMAILESMPYETREHYKNKFAVYLKWWENHGIGIIMDEAGGDLGSEDKVPSWRRLCKVMLKGDYWCKGLSFHPMKTSAYERYKKIMEKRREKWQNI